MTGETAQDGNGGDGAPEVPQTTIECNIPINAANSSVTGTPIQAPGTPNAVLQPVDMGLPPTPTARVPFMVNEDAIDNGYDSDGQLGPFFETGVSEEANFCMDEAPIQAETRPNVESTKGIKNAENVDKSVVPEAVDALDDEAIDKMKVVELRRELEMRGLSKNGDKGVLVKRLKEGIKKNVPLLADASVDQIQNNAGDGFEAGAYWRFLEATGPPLDDSIMEVDGVSFRAATTTKEEHNANFDDRPKKRNFGELFDREPFVGNHLLPEVISKGKSKGKLKKDKVGNFIYKQQQSEQSIPNLKYLFSKGIGFHLHPADWFDIFFPQKRTRRTHPNAVTIHELTSWTNTKAMKLTAGVGGGLYKNFVNCLQEEILSHLGLYLLHSISPSPKIEMKFKLKKWIRFMNGCFWNKCSNKA